MRTCSTTGGAAPAPTLNLRLCHVTRQPRQLRQRPGPSNADRFASPPPHPPALPALPEPLRLRRKEIGPSSLTCASGRRSPPDVAPGAGRGQLASVYWRTDTVPQCLASSRPIRLKERRFGPEKCILEVVFLPSVKAGCAVWVR
ncbi:hypothetical protein MJG53_016326 [Ovis ammon polii x Ovis aries]|uniref:Uncharacterized protein n=1 Tax=Ovis ammon polii x Ovis aries TaxID=2918886 RepID=A0ACB9UB77_9CETA|nr:hypothetical protein MJG53_016326 [Ovis ammon polii x Ovis aries]